MNVNDQILIFPSYPFLRFPIAKNNIKKYIKDLTFEGLRLYAFIVLIRAVRKENTPCHLYKGCNKTNELFLNRMGKGWAYYYNIKPNYTKEDSKISKDHTHQEEKEKSD